MPLSTSPLPHPVRVAVVEDQTIVCELLADFLSSEVGLTVAIKTNRGRSFFDALKTNRVELAVLDIALPDMSGLEILTYLKKNERRVKVIMVSATDRGQPLREALQLGADAIVSKAAPLEHLRTAVHTVLAGGIYVDPEAGAVLSQHEEHASAALTSREREIAILDAKGLSSKGIGQQLGISEKTVTNHRTTLMKKIGAHNTADITRHVTDERWI